ncbi:hypothetical protein ACPWT1_07885 [Ramlibacter sp. MMS24-I3-19]|uniref:hypothetical protein n=1 Tax=Ramlibacter sp. MMS24-I3-19 TaxID=3416606 RepID=UPI003CFF5F39
MLFAFAFAPSFAGAAQVDDFCYAVARDVETIEARFQSMCAPSNADKPIKSALLIAQQPIFDDDDSRKVYLIAACAAIGRELSRRPKLRMSDIWLSDAQHVKIRTAYVLPAQQCRFLQAKVHAGSMSLEQMYEQIRANLVERNVSSGSK